VTRVIAQELLTCEGRCDSADRNNTLVIAYMLGFCADELNMVYKERFLELKVKKKIKSEIRTLVKLLRLSLGSAMYKDSMLLNKFSVYTLVAFDIGLGHNLAVVNVITGYNRL
jgi:hypothetical protein